MKRRTAAAWLLVAALALCMVLFWPNWGGAPLGHSMRERTTGEVQTEPPRLLGLAESANGAEVAVDLDDLPPPATSELPNAPGIQGVVNDGASQPQPHLQVELRNRRQHTIARTYTDQNGRFKFGSLTSPVPDNLELIVRPDSSTIHRPLVREIEPGDDVLMVLDPYPHVVLEFVDAATDRGLQSRFIQIVSRGRGGESPRSVWSATGIPDDPEPFRHTWVVRIPDPIAQLQLKADGYESSPWIDAPTAAEPNPRRIAMRKDPGSMGSLAASIRTDDGLLLERIGLKRFIGGGSTAWGGLSVENGVFSLPLAPGRHRIWLGGDCITLPTEPHEWYVPVALELDVHRGATVPVDVFLRRGGFVRLPEAGNPMTFTNLHETISIQTCPHSDAMGSFRLAGPLPPGTWSYTYTEGREAFAGTVDVVAGEIATSQGALVAGEAAVR